MNSGTCVKCSSEEVYRMTTHGQRGAIAVSLLRMVQVTDYVCAACGYAESWLIGERDKERVREHGDRVLDGKS